MNRLVGYTASACLFLLASVLAGSLLAAMMV
jgi:hypothetical protein